jgi:hypothetical protein
VSLVPPPGFPIRSSCQGWRLTAARTGQRSCGRPRTTSAGGRALERPGLDATAEAHYARLDHLQPAEQSRDLFPGPQHYRLGHLRVQPAERLGQGITGDVACQVTERQVASRRQRGHQLAYHCGRIVGRSEEMEDAEKHDRGIVPGSRSSPEMYLVAPSCMHLLSSRAPGRLSTFREVISWAGGCCKRLLDAPLPQAPARDGAGGVGVGPVPESSVTHLATPAARPGCQAASPGSACRRTR